MFFLKLFSRLPFPVLYFFSYLLFFTLFYLIRYRRNTSFNNIRNSFPELTNKEIKTIQKKAYRNICDSFFEMIKTYSIEEKELRSRVILEDIENLASIIDNKQSALLLTAHTAPAEWVGQALHLQLGCHIDPVYKPAHSRIVDRFIFAARSRYQATPIPYKNLAKDIITRKNVTRCIAILADLSPRRREKTINLNFLNQPTRFFLSVERIAKLTGTAIFFVGVRRTKRGYYRATIRKICDHPGELNNNEITKIYARYTEEIIMHNPDAWLWTHRRWKHAANLESAS